MNAKAAHETRESREFHTCGLRPQDEIPIDRELETLVKSTERIPDAATPEHRFLWNIIGPLSCRAVVLRKQPSADFHPVMIDTDPMTIHDVQAWIGSKGVGHI